MSEKIQIICGHCGSAHVMRDAWAEWDAEKQAWVLGNVFDDGHCETCEGESSLEEVPIEQWQQSLTETHVLENLEYRAEESDAGTIVAIVSDEDVGEIWRATEDPFWGGQFNDLEEALDAARKAIMQEKVRG